MLALFGPDGKTFIREYLHLGEITAPDDNLILKDDWILDRPIGWLEHVSFLSKDCSVLGVLWGRLRVWDFGQGFGISFIVAYQGIVADGDVVTWYCDCP